MEQPVEKTGCYWIGRVFIGVTVSCTGIIPACFTYCLSSLNYRPLKDNSILGLVSHKETEVIFLVPNRCPTGIGDSDSGETSLYVRVLVVA